MLQFHIQIIIKWRITRKKKIGSEMDIANFHGKQIIKCGPIERIGI